MGIFGVIMWLAGVINLFTEPPWSSKQGSSGYLLIPTWALTPLVSSFRPLSYGVCEAAFLRGDLGFRI